MITSPPSFPISMLIAALAAAAANAAVVNVVPGSNNVVIEQVTLLIGGSDVVQNSRATGVNFTGNTPVNVKSVRITDGLPVDLTYFNTEGAAAVNVNPELASISGVGVFDNGVLTKSNNGLQNYATALANTSLDTDLRNFSYHDFLAPGPTTPGTPDLDLLFYRALNIDDYVLVVERWGNSSFEVTALMADGTPYANANVLRLGGDGGTPGVGYEVHDWNTGYATATYFPSQAQALMLFSVEKFFENTNETKGPVYGLRIVNEIRHGTNQGEADIKLLGISNSPFTNNPINPILVPEPSASLMALVAGALLLGRRNRVKSDRHA